MQDHHDEGQHDGDASLAENIEEFFNQLEPVDWLPVLAAAGLIIAGILVALPGALRRQTTKAVIGTICLWGAVATAYLALAKLGHHSLYTLFDASSLVALLGTGCTGLLLLLHLGRAPLVRADRVAATVGLIMAVGAWGLVGWKSDSYEGTNLAGEFMLVGSFAAGVILFLRVSLHILQRDYGGNAEGSQARAPRGIKYALLPITVGTLWTGYALFGGLIAEAGHIGLHEKIQHLEKQEQRFSSRLATLKKVLEGDENELRAFGERGLTEEDIRARNLRQSITNRQIEIQGIKGLLSLFERAIWLAHRAEKEFHLDSEKVTRTVDVISEILGASQSNALAEVEDILKSGISTLDGILSTATNR